MAERERLELFRDLLDQQVLDRRKRNVAKLDGLLMEVREDAPPRIVALEIGTTVALRRISERLARWYEAVRTRFEHAPPFEIPWSKVGRVDIAVHVDIDASESEAYHFERWLRDHVIGPIPGSGAKRK